MLLKNYIKTEYTPLTQRKISIFGKIRKAIFTTSSHKILVKNSKSIKNMKEFLEEIQKEKEFQQNSKQAIKQKINKIL